MYSSKKVNFVLFVLIVCNNAPDNSIYFNRTEIDEIKKRHMNIHI